VAAVYLTIVGGDVADRLVAASTDVAGMTQVHSVTDDGGVARMREVEGVVVPAGKTVVLAPQGMHLMLMNLTRPLVAGERFVVSLRFEHAGPRDVDVAVIAPGQTAPTAP
jgi:copper(I)-binding protein